MPRDKSIDICRGLAIIFVVIGHVGSSYYNSGLLLDAIAFRTIHNIVYSFHMPLFFIISGYLSNLNKIGKTRWQIAQKCLISYGIPYLIFSIIKWGLKYLSGSLVNNKVGFSELLMIPISPLNELWFLYALLFINLIQIYVDIIVKNVKERKAIVLCMSLIIGIVIAYIKNKISIDLGILDTFRYYYWFLLGKYYIKTAFNFIKKLMNCKKGYILAIFSTIVLVGAVHYPGVLFESKIVNFVIDIIIALLGSFVTYSWSCLIKKCKVLEYLGMNSMVVYILHGYCVSFSREILTKLEIPLLNGITPLVFCASLGIGIPVVLYRFLIQKVKVFDFCFYPFKFIKKRNT